MHILQIARQKANRTWLETTHAPAWVSLQPRTVCTSETTFVRYFHQALPPYLTKGTNKALENLILLESYPGSTYSTRSTPGSTCSTRSPPGLPLQIGHTGPTPSGQNNSPAAAADVFAE